MKVLFTFGGIPHYLNALLEKLYKKGVDIVVVTPQKGNATIGQGVKLHPKRRCSMARVLSLPCPN